MYFSYTAHFSKSNCINKQEQNKGWITMTR